MKKVRFNYALLCELAEKHNVTLIGDYDIKGLSCKTRIVGTCCNCCDGKFERTFESLVKIDNFKCTNCINEDKSKLLTDMMKVKHTYTYGLLCELATKHNATLIGDYENVNVTCKTRIVCKCCVEGCGKNFSKLFETLVKFEKFECDDCVIENANKLRAECVEETSAKRKETMIKTTGYAHVSQIPETKEKKKQTLFKNFGKEGMKHPKITEKTKLTILKNFGNEGLKHPKLTEKRRQTILKNFGRGGFRHPNIAEKKRQTSQKNWKTDYPAQSPLVKERKENGMLRNHGKRHSMHVPASLKKMLKSSFTRKDYVFPSGRTISILGDEGHALNHLLNTDLVCENDILAGEDDGIPVIPYTTADGKEHMYYPDIFIPKQNKIIEVKSVWTMNLALEANMQKLKATKALGYDFEIWVYNKRKERIKIVKE